MKLFMFLLVLSIAAPLSAQVAPREIATSAGPIRSFADVYEAAAGKEAPTILVFHQAGGDARGEYGPLIPRLLSAGYNAIAFDVRGGGTRFAGTNRAPATDSTFTYCMAIPEVEAAISVARAEGFNGPLILWGSSYTAALVMQIGARRAADVRAVLAFSPASGPPMAGCEPEPYAMWLARAGVPTLVIKPRNETVSPMAVRQLAALRAASIPVFIPDSAAHGSSVLNPARNIVDTEPHWRAVMSFLQSALATKRDASRDERVTIESGAGWRLVGNVRRPARSGRAPVVALFNKAAGDRHAYDSLAVALARRGIASLRVDLRGHGESINMGRWFPGVTRDFGNVADDVVAVHRWLLANDTFDTTRIAFVGASYSGEAIAEAARMFRHAHAYVALSPGSFSDTSFDAIDKRGANWLFIRSDAERFVNATRLDEPLKRASRNAQLWVNPSGNAHATDIFLADPTLLDRLADWLVAALR